MHENKNYNSENTNPAKYFVTQNSGVPDSLSNTRAKNSCLLLTFGAGFNRLDAMVLATPNSDKDTFEIIV